MPRVRLHSHALIELRMLKPSRLVPGILRDVLLSVPGTSSPHLGADQAIQAAWSLAAAQGCRGGLTVTQNALFEGVLSNAVSGLTSRIMSYAADLPILCDPNTSRKVPATACIGVNGCADQQHDGSGRSRQCPAMAKAASPTETSNVTAIGLGPHFRASAQLYYVQVCAGN